MNVRFNDVYEEIVNLRNGIAALAAAIENANCGAMAKCLLEDELSDLQDQYDDLLNSDILFKNINLLSLFDKVQHCIECIDLDLSIYHY